MLNIFSLQGRLGRLRYFLLTVAVVAIDEITIFALSRLTGQGDSTLLGVLALTSLLAVIACMCLMVRRLHDFGQSGWWTLSVLLLYVVEGHYETVEDYTSAIVMGILLLVVHLAIVLTPGSKNSNRFGEVPGPAGNSGQRR